MANPKKDKVVNADHAVNKIGKNAAAGKDEYKNKLTSYDLKAKKVDGDPSDPQQVPDPQLNKPGGH